jgi:seryl-tRNA synthetase
MHDLKEIIKNIDNFKNQMINRNIDMNMIDKIVELDVKRRNFIQSVEGKRANVKKHSQQIGKLKKSGNDASELMKEVQLIKVEIEEGNSKLETIENEQKFILERLPNIPSIEVPAGKDENDNIIKRFWGEIKEFSFVPIDHVDLGERLNMLDFKAGAKITGSRFVVYKNELARLERALINFMLDQHLEHGYQEIIPPFLLNAQSMYGTGQLPKFEEDLFKISDRDWYLAPTAEVPLTNIKRDELFLEKELPIKYVAYSPCFRSEAGSYGKDTRGLIRLHQFNKVELVNIVSPQDSVDAHNDMIKRACSILEALELPYREVLLCTGDLGFGATKCIDIEVWLPGQKKYREISSISNCGDFQARRANIRFRNSAGKPVFPYTLNGSGLAVGRTLVAIMENYQTEIGTIKVPKMLHQYMGGIEEIVMRD